MSADDGVYVLATKGPEGGVEYHVASASSSAIQSIFECPDLFDGTSGYWGPVGLNSQEVARCFGKSTVFTDKAQALLAAHNLEGAGSTEYGVRILDYSSLTFPHVAESAKPGS